MPASSPITVLTDRGQLQVPAQIRTQLELQTGQRCLWRVLPDGDLHVHIIRNINKVAERRAHWREYVKGTQGNRTTDEIMEDMREDDRETKRDLGI